MSKNDSLPAAGESFLLVYHARLPVISAFHRWHGRCNTRSKTTIGGLTRKTAVPPSKRAHTGKVAVKESNQRWCSDGFEFRCDNGEKLRVTFALDCCDREALHWAVTTGGFDSETVQDVMLGAVERRFGNKLPASPVE